MFDKKSYSKRYLKEYYKKNRNKLLKRSNQLWRVLKAQQTSKQLSVLMLIGCSIEELKEHLESLFLPSMSWNNYGKWHIDHIRPCCTFDLTKLNEQQKCFHYTNLQPLWAKDNLTKPKRVKL